ncbi:hypothetical protein [Asticcacaulis taihuensis]|uniref:Uncharacterized protein n=1 Tax=Asticcacaulis taihuensis TaxID=260084 RepID=A0A1G4S3G9_9CAUL|nr:hypothetical protein [Asticcacaulis taihuensis]SCW62899.1 hypothetical protein SAMN02927928_2337 [Asticcacaulis taihuensis]
MTNIKLKIVRSCNVGFIVALATAFSPLCSYAQSGGVSVNYEAKGNLAITHKLACMSLSDMKTDYTPADIYPAFADCVSKERYDDATQLFMLAGAYAKFDTLRVTDQTAHEASTVLVIESLANIDEAKKLAWSENISRFAEGDEKQHAEICAHIQHVGAPTYYPGYMIQHGMNAFSPAPPAPLVESFNASKAWETTLTAYLQCAA